MSAEFAKIEIPNVGIFYQDNQYMLSSIIGKSKAVRSTRDLIKKVAPSNSTVLILGESGTGKSWSQEHYIHALIELDQRLFQLIVERFLLI